MWSRWKQDQDHSDYEDEAGAGAVRTARTTHTPMVGRPTQSLRNKLDAIDRLATILSDGQLRQLIPVPTIVAIGDQSSGKSSVLESLSGVNLPRGDGCVTRCPLVMQLRSDEKTYAEISAEGYAPKRLDDLTLVGEEIERLTNQLCGTQFQLENNPITLRVCRPGVMDLTLIDLPGITRNPVGKQPHDIEAKIKDMMRHYMKDDAAVLLNVIPASVDFSTSESIRMCKEVDPTCSRSLAVVTKVDIGGEALLAKLTGRHSSTPKLQLGYVAVKNRSLVEIQEGTSFEDMRVRERNFFDEHTELCKLPEEQRGTLALSRKLQNILMSRVEKAFPRVQHRIVQELRASRSKLAKMPNVLQTPVERTQKLAELAMSFQGAFVRSSDNNDDTCIFSDLEKTELEWCLKLQKNLLNKRTYDHLERILDSHRGRDLHNFVPASVVKSFITTELVNVRKILHSWVTKCVRHVENVLLQAAKEVFKNYMNMHEEVNVFLREHVVSVEEGLLAWVERRIDQERMPSHTVSQYYRRTLESLKAAVRNLINSNGKGEQCVRVMEFTADISFFMTPALDSNLVETQLSTCAYYQSMINRLADDLSMEVRYRMVHSLCGNSVSKKASLHNVFLAKFTEEESLERLFREEPEQRHRRRALVMRIEKLKEGGEVMAIS